MAGGQLDDVREAGAGSAAVLAALVPPAGRPLGHAVLHRLPAPRHRGQRRRVVLHQVRPSFSIRNVSEAPKEKTLLNLFWFQRQEFCWHADHGVRVLEAGQISSWHRGFWILHHRHDTAHQNHPRLCPTSCGEIRGKNLENS